MADTRWQGVPGWEQLPNWIAAIATVLALGAAIFAGVWARQAAKHTQRQADAAVEQVTIARDELDMARQEAKESRAAADMQQAQAARAERRLEESRLDALAPVVYARASPGAAGAPGFPPIEYRELAPGVPPAGYRAVPTEEPNGVRLDQADRRIWQFRITMSVLFENVSDHVARVEIPDTEDLVRFDPTSDSEFAIAPHRSHTLLWQRELLSGDLDGSAIDTPDNTTFGVHFVVSDLAGNVRDSYDFNGNLRHFSRPSGSEASLVVHALPYMPPYNENIALPKGPRNYSRL